ncbi:hypothetical protein ACO0QE_003924 [Hanseniaspora vineae]
MKSPLAKEGNAEFPTADFAIKSVVKTEQDNSEIFDDSVYSTHSESNDTPVHPSEDTIKVHSEETLPLPESSSIATEKILFEHKDTQEDLTDSTNSMTLPANLFDVLLPDEKLMAENFEDIFNSAVFIKSNDPKVFGEFVAIVYNITGKPDTFCCYLFDKFGCTYHENVDISPVSKYYLAIENLNEANKKLNVPKVVAVSLLQKYAYAQKFNAGFFPNILSFDPTDAGMALNAHKLVETNSKLTPLQLGQKMQQMSCLQNRTIKSLFIDVLYENTSDVIDDNNKLVFHLGNQLEQLFNPLTEYSPEQTEIVYKPVPPADGSSLMLQDSTLIQSIIKELVDIQTIFTVELVNFLQKYIIPIRIKVSNREIPGISFSKLNKLFPPTIDEVTRINCIFLDALKLAQNYGSLQILKACSVTIAYFYKAYTRHEAATKKFHKDIKLFLAKFNDQLPLNQVYTELKLETIITGPQEKITKYKLILQRLWKEKQWESEAVEEEATKYYNNIIDVIDTFGNQATPSSKTSAYQNRVFTPSGKILTELAEKWPIELQYKWLKRRVVGVFDAAHYTDNKRDVVVIFNDYVVFLNVIDGDLYYSEGSNKPLISDILMNSLINEVPLPNNIPQLTVRKHAHINQLLVTTYGNTGKQIRFDILDGDSSPLYYQLVSPTDTCEYICELIVKAGILCKSTAFHLFSKSFETSLVGSEVAQSSKLKTYVTAHEINTYKGEKIKSPFAMFLNIDPSYDVLKENGVYFGAFLKFVDSSKKLVKLQILTAKEKNNEASQNSTTEFDESPIIVSLSEYTKVILNFLAKVHLKEFYYSLLSPLAAQIFSINEQVVKQVQEPVKFFARGLVKSENLQKLPTLSTSTADTSTNMDKSVNLQSTSLEDSAIHSSSFMDKSKSNSTIATFSSSSNQLNKKFPLFHTKNGEFEAGIRHASTVITRPTDQTALTDKGSTSRSKIAAKNDNIQKQVIKPPSKIVNSIHKKEKVVLQKAPKAKLVASNEPPTKEKNKNKNKNKNKKNRLSKVFASIFGSSSNSTKTDSSSKAPTAVSNKAAKRQSLPAIPSTAVTLAGSANNEVPFAEASDKRHAINKKRFSLTSIAPPSSATSPFKKTYDTGLSEGVTGSSNTSQSRNNTSPLKSTGPRKYSSSNFSGISKTPISSPLKIDRDHLDADLEIPRMQSNIEQDKMFSNTKVLALESPLSVNQNTVKEKETSKKQTTAAVFNDDLYGEILNHNEKYFVKEFAEPSISETSSSHKASSVVQKEQKAALVPEKKSFDSLVGDDLTAGSNNKISHEDNEETKQKSVFDLPEQTLQGQRKSTGEMVFEKLQSLNDVAIFLRALQKNGTLPQSTSYRELFQDMEKVLTPYEKNWNWVSLEKSASLENVKNAAEEGYWNQQPETDLLERYYEKVPISPKPNSHTADEDEQEAQNVEPSESDKRADSLHDSNLAESLDKNLDGQDDHQVNEEYGKSFVSESHPTNLTSVNDVKALQAVGYTEAKSSKLGVEEQSTFSPPSNNSQILEDSQRVRMRINYQSKFRVVKSSSPTRTPLDSAYSTTTRPSQKLNLDEAIPVLAPTQSRSTATDSELDTKSDTKAKVNARFFSAGSESSELSSMSTSSGKNNSGVFKRVMDLQNHNSEQLPSRDISFHESDLEKDLGDSTLEFSDFNITFNKNDTLDEKTEEDFATPKNVILQNMASPEFEDPIFYDFNTTQDYSNGGANSFGERAMDYNNNAIWVSPSKLDVFDLSKKSPSMYERLNIAETNKTGKLVFHDAPDNGNSESGAISSKSGSNISHEYQIEKDNLDMTQTQNRLKKDENVKVLRDESYGYLSEVL